MASLRVFVLFIFRHYLQSWRQSLLTVLGLALGISVFVSIHLTVGASLRSFKNTVQAVSGKAEWQLVQNGREIDEKLFPVIKTPRSIALTRIFAARYGIKEGDVLTILVNGRPKKLTVVSLMEAEGPAQALEGHFG